MKYGKNEKKILFYDTDKRHAELKIKLEYDGMRQSEFFRALVTGYLEEDEDIISFLTSYKEEHETKWEAAKARTSRKKRINPTAENVC